MQTGVAAQDFSPISKINYDTLSQYQALGSQMELQASDKKNDRIRDGIQEAEKNRLLNQQNTGTIAGLLNSNPELMKQIDSGVAPKAVTQALKSYEKGGGNLNSTALLANYLTTSAEQIQSNAVLEFNKEQKTSAANTKNISAQADLLEQENAAIAAQNKPQPLLLNATDLDQFRSDRPNGNFGATPMNVGGKVMYKVGADSQASGSGSKGTRISIDKYNQLVKDNGGTPFKRTPVVDELGNVVAYDVQESYADPEVPSTYQETFMQESAKEDAKNLSKRKADIRDWYSNKKAKVDSNRRIYDDLILDLKAGDIKIRGVYEFMPDIGTFRDDVRALFNSSGQDAVDRVRLVVFQSLKDILGGAFSAQEANRLSLSAYNPQLAGTEGVEKNIQRLEEANRVLKDIQAVKMAEYNAYQAGQEYFGPSGAEMLERGAARMSAQFPVGSGSGTTTSGNGYGGLNSIMPHTIQVKEINK